MNDFTALPLTPGYGYEVDPQEAEELGAFQEEALSQEDVKEALEDEA
jgi:hypothetical protein